jgi:hypothetical protein
VKFKHDCDRFGVTGEVNEILKLVDVRLYIPFDLVIPIGLESHECRGCLVLRAERHREFLGEIVP